MSESETIGSIALRTLLPFLGPRELCVVCCVSRGLRECASDEWLWRELSFRDEHTIPPFTQLPVGFVSWKQLVRTRALQQLPRVGACYEITDTFGGRCAARIVARVGRNKLLFAEEGCTSDATRLLWLHRMADRARVRPLSATTLPGLLGPHGAMDSVQFARLRRDVAALLLASPVTLWPLPPAASVATVPLPSLYARGTSCLAVVRLPSVSAAKWLSSQERSANTVPFASVFEQALHPPLLWPATSGTFAATVAEVGATMTITPPQLHMQCGPTSDDGSIWFCKGRSHGCPGGPLIGIDVYACPSSVCAAALQSGVVGLDGGTFVVRFLPGRECYPSGKQNGILSQPGGQASRSFLICSTV